MPKTKFIALAGFLVFALSLAGVWGQSTSTIVGTITDASGAVIPGAEVTVTNLGTSRAITVLTSDSGRYRVGNLIPGRYEVKASLTGFKTAVGQVLTTVDQISTVSLTLEIGEVTEIVTVMDAGTTVNVEEGRVSSLVDSERIADLPLNGRNVYQLMQTAPGVVNTEATVDEPGQLSNVNGGRANMNGFWMDGVSIRALSGGTGAGDGPGMQPNLEAIQEFRIETLNFSAEYGGNTAAVVSVVSKSGTNDFHGSAFWFGRRDSLDAREFFDAEKPPYSQDQFGGSLGGPIWKDKTFFFASYEGTRIETGESELTTFESPEWNAFVSQYGAPVGAFIASNYPGRELNQGVVSTVGEYLSDFWWTEGTSQAEVDAVLGDLFGSPPGALSAGAPMLGEANYFTPDNSDHNGFSGRIDHNFSENDRLYGRYFYFRNNGTQDPDPRPAFLVPFAGRNHLVALNWTHVFSPTAVNEVRSGLTRYFSDIPAGTPGVPRIAEYGSGVATWGSYNGYPQLFVENVYTAADTMSLNVGNHGIKIGGEFRRDQENSEFDVGRPSYYFFDLVYTALDDPYYQIGGVDPHLLGDGKAELKSSIRSWRGSELGFFFNDDWKVLPNLTLNLGVRWDWFSRLTEKYGRATRYRMDNGGDNIWQNIALGDFEAADQLSENDWNNFAPRFGFAWDPCNDGKMSVRGGYGIAYNGAVFNPLANSRWNKPYYSFNLLCDVCGREGEVLLYGPQDGSPVRADGDNNNPGAATYPGNIIAYDPDNPNLAYLTGIPNPRMRDPYTQSFFFGLQREIARDMTIEANYVGTLGRKLIRAEDFNRFAGDMLGWPEPGFGRFEGDTGFNRINENEGTMRFWENSVNSNYHALQVQFNKRYAGGFALNAHYTWAKALDVRSTWHSGNTSSNYRQEGYSTDLRNIRADYGRAIFDARHRAVFNWLYDVPWLQDSDSWAMRNLVGGWQLNGIMALQSGQPFTPYFQSSFFSAVPGDFNADGWRNDRPNTPAMGSTWSCSRDDFKNPNSGCFNIADQSNEGKLAYFGRPEDGALGTLGRNTYDGPGYFGLDFSLFKTIGVPQISEDARFQLRFEFFNIFNRVNFFQPEPRMEYTTFGRPTETFDSREIQIGVKFIF